MIVAELSANHNYSLGGSARVCPRHGRVRCRCCETQTYTADSLTLDVRVDDFLLKGGLWDGRYLHDLYEEANTPYEWHAELSILRGVSAWSAFPRRSTGRPSISLNSWEILSIR